MSRGVDDSKIHELAWDAFMAGTKVAKEQGLYGAGQDLLKDAFSGNIRGLGPASCEMEFEERPNEPFVFFAADKTDPGAYNLPMYLAFADPMHCAGLLLSPKMAKGFTFTIMDVNHTEGDRVIELNAPEELYDIACLLRDNERFVVESIRSRANNDIAAVVSTSRLHNIAGTYTGKDDPVALVRTQGNFPATGEILSPYRIGHYVAGTMRGSHNGPLMPVKLNSTISFFDGPAIVSGAAFCVHEGKFTEPVDAFDHPFWDWVRNNVSVRRPRRFATRASRDRRCSLTASWSTAAWSRRWASWTSASSCARRRTQRLRATAPQVQSRLNQPPEPVSSLNGLLADKTGSAGRVRFPFLIFSNSGGQAGAALHRPRLKPRWTDSGCAPRPRKSGSGMRDRCRCAKIVCPRPLVSLPNSRKSPGFECAPGDSWRWREPRIV